MPTANSLRSGWRAIALIAITYVYFLIFAQFAFIQRLTQLQLADPGLKPIMASMAVGGVLFSLIAARLQTSRQLSAPTLLRIGLANCAVAALLTTTVFNLPAALGIAFLIGTGLGLLTVTLVTHLSTWLSVDTQTPGAPINQTPGAPFNQTPGAPFTRSFLRVSGEPQSPAPAQTNNQTPGAPFTRSFLRVSGEPQPPAPAQTHNQTPGAPFTRSFLRVSGEPQPPAPAQTHNQTPGAPFTRSFLRVSGEPHPPAPPQTNNQTPGAPFTRSFLRVSGEPQPPAPPQTNNQTPGAPFTRSSLRVSGEPQTPAPPETNNQTPGAPFTRSFLRVSGEPQTPAPPQTALLQVGLGTGFGYLLCNLPPLFTASARTQSLTAATLCLLGLFAAGISAPQPQQPQAPEAPISTTPTPSFPRILLAFTALVWLDSAAFFIIQSTPALKAGTWQGNTHLYLNGALHLVAALLSAWLLRRRGIAFVLAAAFLALAAACLLLLDPHRALLASLFYPIGVSLYSVALVAYPALLFDRTTSGPATTAERARRAGLIYAIAGWIGSALGIGMGQNLGHVPPLFVAVAGLIVLGPALLALLRHRRRELLATAAVLLLALAISRALPTQPATPTNAVDRGRQVYIAEGCIHCHSQYIRPNTADVALWGPTQTLEQLRSQHPPLIGNRRQGPDLSQVGGRRSPAWLRAHFIDPRQLSPTSFMPAYAHLFAASTRGDDLVAYLTSLKTYPTSGEPK